jgi:hypothetical protein
MGFGFRGDDWAKSPSATIKKKEKPGVEMTTKLPDGSMITETYPYKKMPRNP